MIFVTVGSHYQSFERLIQKMDQIAGRINEKVIIQIGHTKYVPKNAEFFDFKERFEDIEQLNHEARVVVSHAGVGSIITAFKQLTPIIIVPRLKRFGEHIDNHQLEISNALSNDPRVLVVYEVENLESILRLNINPFHAKKNNKLSESIGEYISNL